MRSRIACAALCVAALASASSSVVLAAPSANPDAVAAVTRYVDALRTPDAAAAFALLTRDQQRYFGNARNFGSNLSATRFRIESFAVRRSVQRNPHLVEVDVDQRIAFFDIGAQSMATGSVTEAYFALRSGDAWGVKEIFQPWKSYAPRSTGSAGGLVASVDRIEFFDHRIQFDCTLRDMGTKALQVLPLLKSTLAIAGGATAHALDDAAFPPNDQEFFDGVRIYPKHQVVGWISFPLPSRNDADMTVTLTIAPVIEDGATAPASVSVGPIPLPRH